MGPSWDHRTAGVAVPALWSGGQGGAPCCRARPGSGLGATAALALLTPVAGAAVAAGTAAVAAGTAAVAAAAGFGVVALASVSESPGGPLPGEGPWLCRGQLVLLLCCGSLLAG